MENLEIKEIEEINNAQREYKIGDLVELLEHKQQEKHYAKYVIIKIYDKGGYNMYLCKHLKTGVKSTFTDKDLNYIRRRDVTLKQVN